MSRLMGNLWPLFQGHMTSHFQTTSALNLQASCDHISYLAFWGSKSENGFGLAIKKATMPIYDKTDFLQNQEKWTL